MILTFTKMQGLGNDFVVIDATTIGFQPDPGLLAHLANRRTGVGCDQILVIDPPPAGQPDVDFGYRIFNADGSEVGQCGNGARCLARYVREHGLSDKDSLRVRTRTRTLDLIQRKDGRVRVNMGVPRLEPRDIPMLAQARKLRYTLQTEAGQSTGFGAVSMGNPHAVFEVGNVDNAPVAELGQALQENPMFPERVNVGFAHFLDPGHVRLRVYERGAGETPACGSGACAAAVIGQLWGELESNVSVHVNGGELDIEWHGEGEPVWMTGPAETVFEGAITWQN